MKTHTKRWQYGVIAMAAALAPMALAQNETLPGEPEPAPFVAPVYTPDWSNKSISTIAGIMSGDWQTTAPVAAADGSSSVMVMHIAPVPVAGLNDTFYVETARADEQHRPFRQAIFQLYNYKDGIRLRTYEIALPADSKGVMTGLWAAPGFFPSLSADDLIATIDIDLAQLEGMTGGYAGSSPYAYPTGVGGAVEMTSHIELTGVQIVSRDTGYAADGSVVWGSAEGDSYTFSRMLDSSMVTARDDGMVIVEFANPGDIVVGEKDRLHIHYTGGLEDMSVFDSSFPRGKPFIFEYPPGTRTVLGWGIGMDKISVGTRRKLIIPGYMGYGDRGNPRAGIPEDATLYFDIECVHIDKYEPDPAPAPGDLDAPAGNTEPAIDHTGHNHD